MKKNPLKPNYVGGNFMNEKEWKEKYLQKIKKCKDLESLFNIWKKAQIDENSPCYIPGIVEKSYFTLDGYINEEKYNNAKQKILFILKEADIKEKREIDEDNQINWYINFLNWLNNKETQLIKDSSFTRENIARMSAYILNKDIYSRTELKEALESIAIMNINKRGGSGRCNDEELYNLYYKKYKEFILKQIEICEPDIIISMCGQKINEELEQQTQNSSLVFVSMVHPSRGKYIRVNDKEVDIGFNQLQKSKIRELSIENKINFINNKINSEEDLKFNKVTCRYFMKFIKRYEEIKNNKNSKT